MQTARAEFERVAISRYGTVPGCADEPISAVNVVSARRPKSRAASQEMVSLEFGSSAISLFALAAATFVMT
jgi:hypothetical protein